MTVHGLTIIVKRFLLAASLVAAMPFAYADDQDVRIGVLSFRSLEVTQKQWQATEDYLNAKVAGSHFKIVPLYFKDLDLAVNQHELDFVLTNPEHYVSLRSDHSLSAIVTLMPLAEGHPVSTFGGVILTRVDRTDINGLEDLRGKVVASPAEHSLGGYMMQRWALYKEGIGVKELARINFTGMPQDKAVMEVLEGKADVAFVRTGVLEGMFAEGKIKLDQFKIVNRQPRERFPQLLSTELYPEWPMASAPNISEKLIKHVTLALLNIKPDDNAALLGNYYGFSPVGNYASIEAMILRLKANPSLEHEFNLGDVSRKYILELAIAGLLLLLVMLSTAVYLARTNRNLKLSYLEREKLSDELERANSTLEVKVANRTQELQQSEERFRSMLENSPIAIRIAEKEGRQVVFSNQRYDKLINKDTGKSEGADPREYYLHPEVYDETLRQIANETKVTDKLVELSIPEQGIKWALASYMSFSYEGRAAVLGWFYDITQLKHAEQALQQSESRFRFMFERHSSPMMLIEPVRGGIVDVNLAAAKFYGFTIDQMRSMNIAQINMQSPEEITAERLQAQREERNYFVFPHKLSNGEIRTVEVYSSPVEVERRTLLFSIIHDISERKLMEVQMHDLAFYDPLTKLPNRRLLLDRLHKAASTCSRTGRYGALMFLDLDFFKKLNDLHGHDLGDQMLIEVARRIQECIREQDSVARFGGDEFVVMLEGLSEKLRDAVVQTEVVAEKIRESLASPYHLKRENVTSEADQITHYCSTSIGVTVFLDVGEGVEQLLKRTDMAMYRAKDAGRNSIRFFDPEMQKSIEERAEMEDDLHRALEQHEFKLFYQVQVNAAGKAQGAEVLLRWQHPQRGLVSPLQFIPLAEETGMILPIGEWVLNSACAQIKLWEERAAFNRLVLAVNVSAKQFHQPDFVDQVKKSVMLHGIDPMSIKLELTESLVLENVEDAIAKMRELKELGISFAMDDFGTGYSSLSYLKRFPLDQLKIDQSFVRDITRDQGDKVMVMIMVDMGMNFELDVIAEGVETEEQFKLLHRYGCNSFQGYFFSKPVPVEEFEKLIV